MAQGHERTFAEFKHEVVKSSGGSETFLSESTSGALREIANCVAKLSNRLASVCEASSEKSSMSTQVRAQQLFAWLPQIQVVKFPGEVHSDWTRSK